MPLQPLYLWLFALNTMCLIPFTYGPLTFACLLVSVWLLWRLQRLPAIPSGRPLPVTALAVAVGFLCLFTAGVAAASFLLAPDPMIDIGINTLAAVEAFANGNNPYTHRAQLWVTEFPADTPHLSNDNGQLTMFGIPYFHGYPYFPLMMLSYLPGWLLAESAAAIRITHLLLIMLNIVACYWLLERLVSNPAQRKLAWLVSIIAWLGLLRFVPEVMVLGVTDLLISTWLLLCMLALSRQRFFIAGILLGCAQACKLLPAPLVFLCITWLLYDQRQAMLHFVGGFTLACITILLPFIAWHPEGFLSSTILYYLTHHQEGDMTSLWYFLPKHFQTLFLAIGILLTLASILFFNRPDHRTLLGCITGSYASYVIFMSFSKMTHLNYFWGVLPLGCVVLAVMLATRSSQPAVPEHQGTL